MKCRKIIKKKKLEINWPEDVHYIRGFHHVSGDFISQYIFRGISELEGKRLL